MRTLAAIALIAAATASAVADDKDKDAKKGIEVELAGMKSTTPAEWKELDKPGAMRQNQFTAPKADGDKDDADISIFYFKGGGGKVGDNLKRQAVKFQPAAGKKEVEDKTEKSKVGTLEVTYQDLKGTYLKKPFPMAEKATPMADWRQIYVIFETNDGLYSLWIVGPAKTVEKHKKGFDEWLKNFK